MRFFKISMEKPGDSAMGDSLSDFNGLRETRRINELSLSLLIEHEREHECENAGKLVTIRLLSNFISWRNLRRDNNEITPLWRFIETLHHLFFSPFFSSRALIA